MIRGTPSKDSIRCAWRGVARTFQQREETIRLLLGIDESEPLPSPDELHEQFMVHVNQMASPFRATWETNATTLAYGGLNTDSLFLTCYADYRVHEYILGDGNNLLTVAYDHLGEAMSYQLYTRAQAGGRFPNEPLLNEAQYQARRDEAAKSTETVLAAWLGDHESVVFLAPMGAHSAIAVEAWLAVAQWDVQLDATGTVNAVRYGFDSHDREHSQTLESLVSRIATATASDEFAGQRISHTEGLTQYYRDIGAYDDITPGDNETTPFVPAQPPPVRGERP